jgi:hypothetical protein
MKLIAGLSISLVVVACGSADQPPPPRIEHERCVMVAHFEGVSRPPLFECEIVPLVCDGARCLPLVDPPTPTAPPLDPNLEGLLQADCLHPCDVNFFVGPLSSTPTATTTACAATRTATPESLRSDAYTMPTTVTLDCTIQYNPGSGRGGVGGFGAGNFSFGGMAGGGFG